MPIGSTYGLTLTVDSEVDRGCKGTGIRNLAAPSSGRRWDSAGIVLGQSMARKQQGRQCKKGH